MARATSQAQQKRACGANARPQRTSLSWRAESRRTHTRASADNIIRSVELR